LQALDKLFAGIPIDDDDVNRRPRHREPIENLFASMFSYS